VETKTPLFESKRIPRKHIPKPQESQFIDPWRPKRRKHWLEKLAQLINVPLPNPFEVFLNEQ